MPSPFPGMNPYLERDTVWSDFHTEFCKAIKRDLVPQVQPEFFVKFNEHLYVHDDRRRLVGMADVSMTRRRRGEPGNGSVALLDAPVRVRIQEAWHEERIPFLEIFDKEDNTLVTVLELLSPANKRKGPDREQFLSKRRQILKSPVHYVEIDLLRGGSRMPIDDMPKCDYYALSSRASDRPEVGFWPIRLRDPLPTISVPLPEPKLQAKLHLQDLLNRAYDEAGYASYIYAGPIQPKLRKEDAKWVKKLLATGAR